MEALTHNLAVREDENPGERLRHHGSRSLATTEVLALVIGYSGGADSILKAREVLERAGDETRLASCDVETLATEYGLGPRRAEKLAAAFELGRRAQVKQFDTRAQVKQPKDVADRYIPLMRDLAHEEFWVIHLNKANVIIRHAIISKGGVSASVVDAHEVFRSAILDRAASIILMHNHPSGNPEPSREDIALTRALADAGAILQMPVYDHLIVAGSNYTSFKERRLM